MRIVYDGKKYIYPRKPVAWALKAAVHALLVILLTVSAISPAMAQRLALIRDAEIEGLLKDYTTPIFKVAGLGRGAVDVLIVNNDSFNAFVTGRNMFIHTGALAKSDTPNEIIGVIAHETGHIIGGHQVRMRDRIEKAQILGAVGVLLGAGAMISGGNAGESAGAAIIAGSQNTLQRGLLAYQRDEEAAADRSAVTLLDKTRQSADGMLKTFERFNATLLFSGSNPDPYIQSHPLPRARIDMLENLARKSANFGQKDSANLQLRHDMARAKIVAYTQGFNGVQRLFKNDLNGAPARYGLAISQFLRGRTNDALGGIERLIKEQPKNSYLYEMKAEILLRAGRADEGIKPMLTAIAYDPYNTGLLRIQYGQLLLSSKDPKNIGEAIEQLQKGLVIEPKTVSGYGFLARAYAKTGKTELALAATAEERFLVGDYKDARQFALRAQQKLNKNSPQWLRLQDIVLYKPKKK